MAEALREFVPDVILTDHSLPAFDARSALQLAQQLSPGTPVIVVTGRLGDEPAVQYLQAGAADYIVKDHLHRLGPAVLQIGRASWRERVEISVVAVSLKKKK